MTATTDDQICDYLDQYQRAHRFSPTARELAAHFCVSVSTAHGYFVRLRKAGRITGRPGLPRTTHVVHSAAPGEVVLEFTVRINRELYRTERDYLAIARTLEARTEAFINEFQGCKVWARGAADAGEAW